MNTISFHFLGEMLAAAAVLLPFFFLLGRQQENKPRKQAVRINTRKRGF